MKEKYEFYFEKPIATRMVDPTRLRLSIDRQLAMDSNQIFPTSPLICLKRIMPYSKKPTRMRRDAKRSRFIEILGSNLPIADCWHLPA
jgi:hypothetical protein